MGLVNLFSKDGGGKTRMDRLPSGSFTVDARGQIVISTIPQWFPKALTEEIAAQVIATFRGAQAAQLHLGDLVIHYPALKITARELRGGAIIFLAPKAPQSNLNSTTDFYEK